MIAATVPFASFWSAPWSAPLRAACVWLKRQPAPVVPDTPNALAPGWLRPLCVQRWVGQAIAARLAWMRAHPDLGTYRFVDDSLPSWERGGWQQFARREVRAISTEALAWVFAVEVECLLRIVQTPPALVGEEDWTQVYGELRLRYGARATRVFVWEALQEYVAWECPSEVA